MINNKLIIIVICLVNLLSFGLLPGISQGQEWTWSWANKATRHYDHGWVEGVFVDGKNFTYATFPYSDSIFFPDTIFSHPYCNDYTHNYAIGRYDYTGNLIDAFDLHTQPGNVNYRLKIVTDDSLNIYMALQFMDRLFFLDTAINHGPLNIWPEAPDVVVMKFSPDYQFKWARVINGSVGDQCTDLLLSPDGNLYLVTEHQANSNQLQIVNFFDQDSTQYLKGIASLMKLSPVGNIIWRKEIRNISNSSTVREILIDSQDNVLLRGTTRTDLLIDGDTLFLPENPHFPYLDFPYLVSFSGNGEVQHDTMLNWTCFINDLESDMTGNFYFSIVGGEPYDSVCIGSDTLVFPGDSVGAVIIKTNSLYEPEWMRMLKGVPSTFSNGFYLHGFYSDILFAVEIEKKFIFLDSLYDVGHFPEVMCGKFSAEGDLVNSTITNGMMEISLSDFNCDHCGNMLIGGTFRGTAIFGDDTLISNLLLDYDACLASLQTIPREVSIGPDTSVCDTLHLTGPPGYVFYNWNDGLSFLPDISVSQSGSYWLAVANEDCCWAFDTIVIDVFQTPVFSLGPDTVIDEKDSIFLLLPENYQSYIWFSGDTTPFVWIKGGDLGYGIHRIWCEVTNGPCMAMDSMNLEVKWNPVIGELFHRSCRIFPNPTNGTLFFQCGSDRVNLKLFDINGIEWNPGLSKGVDPGTGILDMTDFPPGVYILEIRSENDHIRRKVIKY